MIEKIHLEKYTLINSITEFNNMRNEGKKPELQRCIGAKFMVKCNMTYEEEFKR